MKHTELRAIVHNVADSLASGCSLLTGFYDLDVLTDAAQSEAGALTVDLLNGRVIDGQPSPSTAQAVASANAAMSDLLVRGGGNIAELHRAEVRFWSDPIERRVLVTIRDSAGRQSSAEYAGIPAKRVQVLDALGRRRPKPGLG